MVLGMQSFATKKLVTRCISVLRLCPDLCNSEIPQYASIHAGTAVVGCLQYEGDRLGVDDKGREGSSLL